MTIDAVKAVINEVGGPERVLGFRFANGYKVVYSTQARKVIKDKLLDINEDINQKMNDMGLYHHKDTMGHTATSYIDFSEIVQVYTVDDPTKPIILRDFME